MMVQLPTATGVSTPALVTVQTLLVAELKTGVRPDEALAVSVGELPISWLPGLAKVMVCAPIGTTGADAAEAVLVPALLVAVTVKV